MQKGQFKNSIQFGSSKLFSKISPNTSNQYAENKYTKNLFVKQDIIKKFTNIHDLGQQKSTYLLQNNENDNKQSNSPNIYTKPILNDIRTNKNIPINKSNCPKNINTNILKGLKDKYSNEVTSQNKLENKFKSGYMTKKNQEDSKYYQSKYEQRNSFDRLSQNIKSMSKNTVSRHFRRSSQQLDYKFKTTVDKQNIQKLNQKLYLLQNRINTIKDQMQKKKEMKKNLLQQDFKQRKLRDLQRMEKTKDLQENNKQREPLMEVKIGQNFQIKTELNSELKQNKLLKEVVTKVPKYNKQLSYFSKDPYSPRHNIYYVSEIVRTYKQINSLTRQHLISSMKMLKAMKYSTKATSNEQVEKKKIKIQKSEYYKDKKTVIFDLDETLIHCNDSIKLPYDVKIDIKFPNGQIIEAGINIRPYACQIIKNLAKNFQIIIFTASHSCYANLVIDQLDPEKKYIQHRLFRQDCYVTSDGIYIKDLRIIPRNMRDMVLVDNAAYSYFFQLQNGIPIIPYYQGKNDYELKALERYIQKLNLIHDVRQMNNKTFKLNSYANYDNEEILVKSLYIQN